MGSTVDSRQLKKEKTLNDDQTSVSETLKIFFADYTILNPSGDTCKNLRIKAASWYNLDDDTAVTISDKYNSNFTTYVF